MRVGEGEDKKVGKQKETEEQDKEGDGWEGGDKREPTKIKGNREKEQGRRGLGGRGIREKRKKIKEKCWK